MRFLLLLPLISLSAFAQTPKELSCAQTAYTIECIPSLPMPCPQPPVHAPLVFATAPFDDVAQTAQLNKDTRFENFPLSLYARATYSTDGDTVNPTLQLSLTDASGVSATAQGSSTVSLTMRKSKDLGKGKISSTTVMIRCSID